MKISSTKFRSNSLAFLARLAGSLLLAHSCLTVIHRMPHMVILMRLFFLLLAWNFRSAVQLLNISCQQPSFRGSVSHDFSSVSTQLDTTLYYLKLWASKTTSEYIWNSNAVCLIVLKINKCFATPNCHCCSFGERRKYERGPFSWPKYSDAGSL